MIRRHLRAAIAALAALAFSILLRMEPGMPLADVVVLGILEPSFDTQCRQPRIRLGGIVLFWDGHFQNRKARRANYRVGKIMRSFGQEA
jgi:hypothetical protein